MATLQYLVRATDDASATFMRIAASADNLNKDLNKLDGKTATATAKLEDKQLKFDLDDIELKMARLDKRVTTTHMNDDQIARARHEADRLSLALDKLNAKRTKIHVDDSALTKLSKASFQPSLLGTAVALSPALIPLAGQIAGAVGAIGISFGAAGIAAGGFGLVAKSVLTNAGSDATKLATLQAQLAKDTTAKQKAATQQQITALETGWSGAYTNLVTQYQQFTTRWEKLSSAIATPALAAWFDALNKMLKFLRPALQPVADLFEHWGKAIARYFADPITALRVKNMAAVFGNFAAIQLGDIAKFVTDVAKAFLNLGKDLVGSGAKLGAAGTALQNMGDSFLAWSKTKKARDDVQGFMHFLHQEGPVVTGILKDLGTILPGIFAGATTVGTLELKALGDFLNLVANLPKGWQKPLTEFAGAMLLLSKIGIVKVGLKLTGLEGALAIPGLAGAGSAGGPFAVAGAAMAAGVVLKFREDFKTGMKNSAGALGHDIAAVFSGLGGFAATGAQGLADTLVAHFSKQARQGFHDAWHAIAASFDAFRHTMSASFDAFRHDIVSSFKADWHDIAASFAAFRHTMASSFDAFRHTMSASFAALRHDIATAWDTIWRNTVTRTRHGIDDLMNWFRTIPGRAVGALRGFGHGLAAFASAAFNEMWNAIKNVAGNIWHWLTSWVNRLPSWLRHLLGIRSPSSVFYDIGKQMMMGLFHGIQDHAHHARNAARSAAGGGFMDTGARSGSAMLAQQYAAAQLSQFGWGRTQFGPLLALWNQESGWNAYAVNPSSGAYGIPQSLGHGHPYNLGDYKAQIIWGLNYIAQRYGSPGGAWAHEQAFNWYGSGLSGGIFNRPTLIGVGDRGPERVDVQPVGTRRREGPLLVIEHLHVREAADVDLLARRLAFLDA